MKKWLVKYDRYILVNQKKRMTLTNTILIAIQYVVAVLLMRVFLIGEGGMAEMSGPEVFARSGFIIFVTLISARFLLFRVSWK